MAYFGRTPKKPQTTPGSGSGFVQQEGEKRLERAVRRLTDSERPERPGRASKAVRAVRGARGGRSAR
jgi:hypothetical protein